MKVDFEPVYERMRDKARARRQARVEKPPPQWSDAKRRERLAGMGWRVWTTHDLAVRWGIGVDSAHRWLSGRDRPGGNPDVVRVGESCKGRAAHWRVREPERWA
jgi:hypothetical protein